MVWKLIVHVGQSLWFFKIWYFIVTCVFCFCQIPIGILQLPTLLTMHTQTVYVTLLDVSYRQAASILLVLSSCIKSVKITLNSQTWRLAASFKTTYVKLVDKKSLDNQLASSLVSVSTNNLYSPALIVLQLGRKRETMN